MKRRNQKNDNENDERTERHKIKEKKNITSKRSKKTTTLKT